MKMNACIKMALLAAAAASLAGCGGSWKDSPKNWERAFEQPKPADVEVVQSIYWKASGVAPQFRWFFQVKSNAALIARFSSNDNFGEMEVPPGPIVTNICGKKPEWFIPKTPESYRTWMSRNLGAGNMMVYEDRVTHEIFICDYLLLPESRAQFQ